MATNAATDTPPGPGVDPATDFYRFHRPHGHLSDPFGAAGLGRAAESFARFFGTPGFLLGQTVVVAAWIALNVMGIFHFDLYPFILLNLAFSLQAAYAAPLILLAQTRQADRDKAHAEADARHREDLARMSLERQEDAVRQAETLRKLLETNTELTRRVEQMAARIDALTREIHDKVVAKG